jgi:hypothetical protein
MAKVMAINKLSILGVMIVFNILGVILIQILTLLLLVFKYLKNLFIYNKFC